MASCRKQASVMQTLVRCVPGISVLLRVRSRIVLSQTNPSTPVLSLRREFGSTTPRPQITRARKRLYAWVRRSGKNFLRPAKSGTNYVTCYDDSGQLLRDKEGREREEQTKEATAEEAKSMKEQEDEEAGLAQENDENASEEDSKLRDDEEGRPTRNRENSTKKRSDAEKNTRELQREDLQPFPQNPVFRSEPVLSPQMRDEIHARVVARGKTIRQVSQEMQVEMRRVAAVVRMKTMEQNWIKDSKPLALRYQAAMLSMLPVTPLRSDREALRRPHESINQLMVHNSTRAQLFYPTHETHQFTRADAAKIFKKNLLPADERIPHPDMVKRHRAGLNERITPAEEDRRKADFYQQEVRDMQAKKKRDEEREERHKERVDGKRWQFVFHDVRTEDAGSKGRGRRGVGWRYGRPHMDRRKGEVKIATKVET